MYDGNSLLKGKSTRLVLRVFLLLLFYSSAHADLILTSPPRESAANGKKQYVPIANLLTKVLGVKVIYKQAKGWLFYQRDMRADRYDIIFDGPHFISWRIKRFGHIPVAKLPGYLRFVVVMKKGETGFDGHVINSLEGLVNQPVCGFSPPNLAALTALAQYKNPVSLPDIISAKGGMNGVYKLFKSGKCKAVILRDKYYIKKVPEKEREGLVTLFRSDKIANQGITVSKRVTDEQRAKIITALTQETPATMPTLKRFGGKAKKFIPATDDDYKDYYKLLTGVIFGWEIPNNE